MAIVVLYRTGSVVRATMTNDLPASCMFRGRHYSPSHGNLGDFNHLLDLSGQVVGFDFLYFDVLCPEFAKSKLVVGAENARLEEGSLRIFLKPTTSYEVTGDNVIGSWLYEDDQGNHIIAVSSAEEFTGLSVEAICSPPENSLVFSVQ